MDTKTLHEDDKATARQTSGQTASERLRAQSTVVREDLRELGHATRDVAQEKLGEARQTAAAYYDHGKKKATEWENVAVDYVRERPVKSVLMAAGVGVLIGMLLRLRR